jgi:hypothetical protein
VFGGVLAGSGGNGGVGDVVAIGMRGKAGGVGRRQVAARGSARNKSRAKGKRKAKMAKAHGDAGRIKG